MSLYCAQGGPEADLTPHLKELFTEALSKLGRRAGSRLAVVLLLAGRDPHHFHGPRYNVGRALLTSWSLCHAVRLLA